MIDTLYLPGETKVGKLNLTLVIDENVATFNVPVEKIPIVAIGQALHNLLHY